MLRTRLWMGFILVALTLTFVFLDHGYLPSLPLFGALVAVVAVFAVIELRGMLPLVLRPHIVLSILGVEAVLCGNWLWTYLPAFLAFRSSWQCVATLYIAVLAVAVLVEMAVFHGPDNVISRLAGLTFIMTYLGLLPFFLIQLRWLHSLGIDPGSHEAHAALLVAIFGPKVGDIGAYFVGRQWGKRPMAPVLSPKKTLEGAAGGILAAAVFVLLVQLFVPIAAGGRSASGIFSALLLGAVLGLVGIFGDLTESLLKRDSGCKDASQTLPGFGGILDVIDSILFAAPVVYWWLA